MIQKHLSHIIPSSRLKIKMKQKTRKQMISPDLPPVDSLAATRFTIGDFDVSCKGSFSRSIFLSFHFEISFNHQHQLLLLGESIADAVFC